MNRLVHRLSRPLKRWHSIGHLLRCYRLLRARCLQFVDLPLRQLGVAVRRLENGPVDVLFLGNSTNLFVAPDEPRSLRLQDLIEAKLGDDITKVALIGPGYGAALHSELVRVLALLEQRPRVIVVAMAVRTSTVHVLRHPEYGYSRSMEFLKALDNPHARLPYLSWRNRSTAEDFTRFHALPVTTRWGRGQTIGEYQSALRGRRAAGEDLARQRTLFDYLHGENLALAFHAGWLEVGVAERRKCS